MELEDDAANQVLYRIMGTEDIPAVLEAVARAFFEGEPVTAAARPPLHSGGLDPLHGDVPSAHGC